MTNLDNLKTSKQKSRRKKFIENLNSSGTKFLIAANDAFVRSIQSIGYKSSGSAGADIIDNSVEANATKICVDIVSGKNGLAEQIIYGDNGIGMEPTLIRYGMTFGGTDRENSSDLFGRFGFGMPAACMSQGNRMIVISREEDQEIYINTFDLSECSEGKYTDDKGVMCMPEPSVLKKLPDNLQKLADEYLDGFKSGTFVIMDQLNSHSLTARRVGTLKEHFLRHFGVTYHKYLNSIEVNICNSKLQAIDPSFTTVSARAYDVGGLKAETFEPMIFEMKDEITGKKGNVTVTFSYLGPQFVKDELRGKIAREWNGFIISRNGRVIDCLNHIPNEVWHNKPKRIFSRFLNRDSWFKCIIDFDASLDNLFSITTTKQQAMPKGYVWDILEGSKSFFPMLTELRKRGDKEKKAIDSKAEHPSDGPRASEIAIKEASEFENPSVAEREFVESFGDKKLTETAKQVLLAEDKLPEDEKDAEKAVSETKKVISGQMTNGDYVIGFRDVPGGNFMFVELLSSQLRIDINTAHKFYDNFYMNSDSNPVMRQHIELFLATIGFRVHRNFENIEFYEREISAWSTLLSNGITSLPKAMKKVG